MLQRSQRSNRQGTGRLGAVLTIRVAPAELAALKQRAKDEKRAVVAVVRAALALLFAEQRGNDAVDAFPAAYFAAPQTANPIRATLVFWGANPWTDVQRIDYGGGAGAGRTAGD